MLIITIAIPDRGEHEACEAAEQIESLVEDWGGEVLTASILEQDGGDLDTRSAR